MGVHGLWSLVKPFGTVTNPEQWRGKRLAVDASIWISQFSAMARPGDDVKEVVLQGFINRLMKLIFFEIEPIIVFDGAAPILKVSEQARRQQARLDVDERRIERQAKRILAAQVANGLVDVTALPKLAVAPRDESPAVTRRSPKKSPVKRRAIANGRSASASAPRPPGEPRFHKTVKQRSKLRRQVTEEHISKFASATTASFIEESVEVVRSLRAQQARSFGNQLAGRTHSNTSLFVGSRRALEAQSLGTDRTQTQLLSVISDDDAGAESDSDDSVELVGTSLPPIVVPSPRDRTPSVVSVSDTESAGRRVPSTAAVVHCLDSDGEDVVTAKRPRRERGRSPGAPAVAAPSTPPFAPQQVLRMRDEGNGPRFQHPTFPDSNRGGASLRSGQLRYEQLEIVNLLELCGIPYIFAPTEADSQCAFMSRCGLVDGVLTEDSDVLVFGAAVVVRGFFGNGHVHAYRAADLVKAGLTPAVLAGFAMLVGCDYSVGVRHVGAVNALDIIAAFLPPKRPPNTQSTAVDEHRRVFRALMDFSSFVRADWGAVKPWRDAIEDKSVLQFGLARLLARKLQSQVELPGAFPEEQVMRAFAAPVVDESQAAFKSGVVNFDAVRRFASIRGLQSVMQRIVVTESAWKKRLEERASAAAQGAPGHTGPTLLDYGFSRQQRHSDGGVTNGGAMRLSHLHLVV